MGEMDGQDGMSGMDEMDGMNWMDGQILLESNYFDPDPQS